MSGHSHWAGIKHKKEATDQKRGKVFSKLLAAVAAAAKSEPNPEFNPRLRTAVVKAREASVPQENIDRAIKRASEPGVNLDELLFEAYGPGGAALLIEAISDNRNRTVQEVKTALRDFGGKWAESGSVQWAFEPTAQGQQPSDKDKDEERGWRAKFPQEIPAEDSKKLEALVDALLEIEDIQKVFTNAANPSPQFAP